MNRMLFFHRFSFSARTRPHEEHKFFDINMFFASVFSSLCFFHCIQSAFERVQFVIERVLNTEHHIDNALRECETSDGTKKDHVFIFNLLLNTRFQSWTRYFFVVSRSIFSFLSMSRVSVCVCIATYAICMHFPHNK